MNNIENNINTKLETETEIKTDSNFTYVPIVFDKSHLLTIGKRLYNTSLDLIRELISNAYDADATVVNIDLRQDEIIITDNGSGMDENHLRQYFTIGSQEKRLYSISPKFQRKRIGEFGIGKFSALTIAERFIIETQQSHNKFRARLIFDSNDWNNDPENWRVPCEFLPFSFTQQNGTTIILRKIKKTLEPIYVARHIRERLPIGTENFRVFVNGNEVKTTSIPGKRFPVNFTTAFGPITGEIILANIPQIKQSMADAGVVIRVKNVSVTKTLFGFEVSHSVGLNRIRGWINSDFLPITSSRDNVIQDSDEYLAIYEKMKDVMRNILGEAKNLSLQKENKQASEILRDALDKIGKAFKKNSQMFQDNNNDINPPLGVETIQNPNSEEGYSVSRAQFVNSDKNAKFKDSQNINKKPKTKRGIFISLANRAIIRRMHFRNLGIVCRMERFGPKYPPSFLEQDIIYLNIDHPLYRKQLNNSALLTMFIATLITKEISLKKYPSDTALAFDLQSQLLTDAFKDTRKL